MKSKTLFIACIPLLYALCSCGPTRPIEDRMQKVLDEGISQYEVRGVSASVIFPDDTIWTGVSGVSHDTVAMKPDMLFAIGSITKTWHGSKKGQIG